MPIEEDKLKLEIQKLTKEVRHLDRPAWRTPAGITAILAIAAFVAQFLHSQREYNLANLERAKVEHEIVQLQDKKTAHQHDLDALKDERDRLTTEQAFQRKQVATLTTFLQENAGLNGAHALIERLHQAHFPLSFSANNYLRDATYGSCNGTVGNDGTVTINVQVSGYPLPNQNVSIAYKVEFSDIETGEVLQTIETGQITWPVKGYPFKSSYSKDIPSTKLDKRAFNRLFVSSQVKITKI